jgi:hypothetical protein
MQTAVKKFGHGQSEILKTTLQECMCDWKSGWSLFRGKWVARTGMMF